MASIARREQGPAVYPTEAATTVTVPAHDFADYLELTCAQIRRYGASEPTVGRSLIRLLVSVSHATAAPDRHAAISRQLRLIIDDAEREVAQPQDVLPLRAEANALQRCWPPTRLSERGNRRIASWPGCLNPRAIRKPSTGMNLQGFKIV
jgi:uncharacterized membrane protein